MLEFRRNWRSASLALSPPVKLEALVVPSNESSRRYDGQRAAPIETSAQPQEGQARWMGDPTGFDSAFLVEGKLFAQEEIFRCERAFRS
jgi:hypothetical protein